MATKYLKEDRHKMARKYFGTDGIRGRVGEYPVTADFMLKLGWASGKVFSKEGRGLILIGKDTRVSVSYTHLTLPTNREV